MLRWRSSIIIRGLWAGLFSGILLGLFLKIVEQITSYKVYTLLLNVDYIPVVNSIKFSETVEFGLHLFVAVILSILLTWYVGLKHWSARKRIYFGIGVGLMIGLLLYPTTFFSDRTPELTSIPSLILWLLGHGLYGWVLGILLAKKGNCVDR